jgi:hypothetical protein
MPANTRTIIQFETSPELRKVIKRIVLDLDLPNYGELILPLIARAYGEQYPELHKLVAEEVSTKGE